MTSYTCIMCKHYLKEGKCKAFPNGIDERVATGKSEHKTPLSGQGNKIVYEPFNG